jgi:cell wall-associated NlpC family hydrolase
VYSQLGISLHYDGSNTAAAQGRYIVENNLAVAYDSLAPGDLVFYSLETNNRYMNISHIGIYAGDGYIVDASSTKKKVVYRPLHNAHRIVLCGRPYTN